MKTLISVISCFSLRHWHEAIKSTWHKDIPHEVDCRFFLGNQKGFAEKGEVFLNVGDTLQDLSHKTVATFGWALEYGYDFCLKVDLDTLVNPVLFSKSGYENYDWIGGQNSFFASGGAGYCLSKKAMKAVVAHLIEPGPAEDVNTAHALLEKDIKLHSDSRYKFVPGDRLEPNTITYHLSSVKGWDQKSTPEELIRVYTEAKNGLYTSQTAVVPMTRTWKRLRRP
jgi:hypothetical protein